MEIKIKLLSKNAVIPAKATEWSNAYDLFCPRQEIVAPEDRTLIPIDIALELPKGYVADVRPRSGYSLNGFADKEGKRHDADVILGTIDSDYRGNIGVIVASREKDDFVIGKGQRIAQLLIHKSEEVCFVESKTLNKTGRGEQGFSHSGN